MKKSLRCTLLKTLLPSRVLSTLDRVIFSAVAENQDTAYVKKQQIPELPDILQVLRLDRAIPLFLARKWLSTSLRYLVFVGIGKCSHRSERLLSEKQFLDKFLFSPGIILL